MNIVQQILAKVGIRKTQIRYLGMLVGLWLAIPGRINYLNLERYGELSEKSHRSWFEKATEFVGINQGIIEEWDQEGEKQWVLGIDSSHVRKSGKATPNLGKYWQSKQGKAVKGLEVSCCSLIELGSGQAFGLHMRASEASEVVEKGVQTRLEQYVGHLHDVLGCLDRVWRDRIKYVVADSYYAKQGFIEAVRQQDKHLIGKLRQDADLRYLYSGSKSGKRGRPKLYDGKVDYQDWSSWQELSPVGQDPTESCIYTVLAYSPKFKMILRVVAVLSRKINQPPKHQLFFSTDLNQDPQQILAIYHSRFQIEFLFRDTKQHLALEDCQSRQSKAIEFHWNISLTTLNFAKLTQLNAHLASLDTFTFSIEDAKRRAYNQLFANRFLSILPLIPTSHKYLHQLQTLLNLGVKAA
jgi:Transposase DDE domain